MRQYTPDARTYELMTVLSPDVPEDDITGVLDAISGYVTDAGGSVQEVLRDSPWGRRRLAYPIRHAGRDVRDGYYTLYHLELAPHRVEDVERDLKLNTQVIRYLVTHYTPKPIDPRAQMDAEIDAEEAAAAAYAAAQAAAQPTSTGPAEGGAPAPAPEATVETEAAPSSQADETSAPDVPAQSESVASSGPTAASVDVGEAGAGTDGTPETGGTDSDTGEA